jgi:predicted O-linked N-acetylglucosamine transferase (SPINDLY family)
MPPVYTHAIPSIQDVNPNIPAVLAQVDLNRRIAANSDLNRDDLRQAKIVAKTLSLNEAEDPLITRAIVESARLRAKALEDIHAQAEYGAGNINQILANIQQQLAQIGNDVQAVELQVRIGRAETANARIITRNFQLQGGLVLAPLQKTIEGSGLLLAEGLAPTIANRDALRAAFQNFPLANIGDIPPFFIPEIERYQHSHLLLLIAFYNDDFGIIFDDTLPQRCIKFRRFLTAL